MPHIEEIEGLSSKVCGRLVPCRIPAFGVDRLGFDQRTRYAV